MSKVFLSMLITTEDDGGLIQIVCFLSSKVSRWELVKQPCETQYYTNYYSIIIYISKSNILGDLKSVSSVVVDEQAMAWRYFVSVQLARKNWNCHVRTFRIFCPFKFNSFRSGENWRVENLSERDHEKILIDSDGRSRESSSMNLVWLRKKCWPRTNDWQIRLLEGIFKLRSILIPLTLKIKLKYKL